MYTYRYEYKNTREFPELFWHPARRCNIDPSVYMPAAAPALSTLTSSYDEMNMSLQRAPRTGLDEANRAWPCDWNRLFARVAGMGG